MVQEMYLGEEEICHKGDDAPDSGATGGLKVVKWRSECTEAQW
jgi:hypothetical protein